MASTATQAIIKYVSPNAMPCQIEVSEFPGYNPLVHDVDSTLFPGANLDSRPSSVAGAPDISSGAARIVVIGKRRADRGIDGLRYSRALQTNTLHYFRITCGGALPSTGSFTTMNIPYGNTHTDPATPSDNNLDPPGSYAWPTLSETDRTQRIIDPLTGVLMKRSTLPALGEPYANTGSGGFNDACSLQQDANGYYHCIYDGGALYGIKVEGTYPNRDVTDVRFLGKVLFAGPGGMQGCGDPSGQRPFDANDPNLLWCVSGSGPDPETLVKLTYTGNDAAMPYGENAIFPHQTTPVTQIQDEMVRFTSDPQHYASPFPSSWGLIVATVQGRYVILRGGGQNSLSWYGVFDTVTSKVIAATSTWDKPSSRWAGDHGVQSIGNLPILNAEPYPVPEGWDGSHWTATLSAPMSACRPAALPWMPAPACEVCPANAYDSSLAGQTSCSAMHITSSWDSSWGPVPAGFQPGEMINAVTAPLRFLMKTLPGDELSLDGERVIIMTKDPARPGDLVVQRGIRDGGDVPDPTAHNPKATVVAMNDRIDSIVWDFVHDPYGTNSAYYAGLPISSDHSVLRGFYKIVPDYQVYMGDFSQLNTWRATPNLRFNVTTPGFAGVLLPFPGNNLEKHPSMNQVNAPVNERQWFLDSHPFLGMGYDNVTGGFTNLGGDIWTLLRRPYSGDSDETLKRKQVETMASCGWHPLRDVSGPASQIRDPFTYCVAEKDGECMPGSKAQQMYVDCPGTKENQCGNKNSNADICVFNNRSVSQSDAQWDFSSINPALNYQQNVIADGSHTRVLGQAYVNYRWGSGAGGGDSAGGGGVGNTWNTKILPDGSWTVDFMQRVLQKIPPQPVPDGIARNTFIGAQLNLAPPTGIAVNDAIVEFGYAENGGPENYFCTSRQESCVATSNSIDENNPFYFEQTENYRGMPCSAGCSVKLPLLPQRTAYFRVKYRDGSGNVIAAGDTGVAQEFTVVSLKAVLSTVSVSVTPGTALLTPSQSQQLTATVTGTTNGAVTWSMTPAVGAISSTGLYTAPARLAPSSSGVSQTITVVATSVADPTRSAACTITLTADVSVRVSPSGGTLLASQSQAFTATVAGTTNAAVSWSISPAVGTISASGVYTAPPVVTSPTTVTVTARNIADTSRTAFVVVNLQPNPTVTPGVVSLAGGQSQQFTAQGAVRWSISPNSGAISPAGLFTAPASSSIPQTVTVTATFPNGETSTATVSVSAISPKTPVAPTVSVRVTPAGATLLASQNQPFTATVTGTTNTAVSWSVSPAVGTVSASGLYTAPSAVVSATAVTVIAKNVADPSKTASATVNLQPNPTVSPATVTLAVGQSQQFTAQGAVGWKVQPNGSAISPTGLFTAAASWSGPTASTPQSVTITATFPNGRTTSATAIITVAPSNTLRLPIRVNAGGDAYTDAQGNVWSADTGYVGGLSYSTPSPIAGTTIPALYQTERFSTGPFQYQFPVPNGSYIVNLKFAEIYYSSSGRRIFNVALNGQTVLPNFDPAQAGGAFTAVERQFSVSVTNGQIIIQLSPVADVPTISAIEILPQTSWRPVG